jgi:hypothetical protein
MPLMPFFLPSLIGRAVAMLPDRGGWRRSRRVGTASLHNPSCCRRLSGLCGARRYNVTSAVVGRRGLSRAAPRGHIRCCRAPGVVEGGATTSHPLLSGAGGCRGWRHNVTSAVVAEGPDVAKRAKYNHKCTSGRFRRRADVTKWRAAPAARARPRHSPPRARRLAPRRPGPRRLAPRRPGADVPTAAGPAQSPGRDGPVVSDPPGDLFTLRAAPGRGREVCSKYRPAGRSDVHTSPSGGRSFQGVYI